MFLIREEVDYLLGNWYYRESFFDSFKELAVDDKSPAERLHDAIDRGDCKEAHKLADEMMPKPKEQSVKVTRIDEASLAEAARRCKREDLIANLIGVAILITLLGSLIGLIFYLSHKVDQYQTAIFEKTKEASAGPVVSDLDLFNKFDGRHIIRFYDEQLVVHVRCPADMNNSSHHDCSEMESWSNSDGIRDHFLHLDSETYAAVSQGLYHGNIDIRAAFKIRQERRDIRDKLNKDRPEY